MNELKTFNHPMFGKLPVLVMGNEHYFGGNEVAGSLEYARPYKAISDHCDSEGVLTRDVLTNGGTQQKRFISLGNVSRLIVAASKQSKNLDIQEKAKEYEKWVFDEVIPSVHKDGGYIATTAEDDEMTIMAKAMMIANKTMERQKRENEALHQRIEADAPFTKFGKVVAVSDGAVNVGVFAKMIYEKHGINLGRNKLIAWLRDNGYLIKQKGAEKNLPKQRYVEQGWFRIRPTVVARTEGDIQTGTTLITGKGQIELTQILLDEFSERKKGVN